MFWACGDGKSPGPAALGIFRACGAEKFPGPAALENPPCLRRWEIPRACGAGEFLAPAALKSMLAPSPQGIATTKTHSGAERRDFCRIVALENAGSLTKYHILGTANTVSCLDSLYSSHGNTRIACGCPPYDSTPPAIFRACGAGNFRR